MLLLGKTPVTTNWNQRVRLLCSAPAHVNDVPSSYVGACGPLCTADGLHDGKCFTPGWSVNTLKQKLFVWPYTHFDLLDWNKPHGPKRLLLHSALSFYAHFHLTVFFFFVVCPNYLVIFLFPNVQCVCFMQSHVSQLENRRALKKKKGFRLSPLVCFLLLKRVSFICHSSEIYFPLFKEYEANSVFCADVKNRRSFIQMHPWRHECGGGNSEKTTYTHLHLKPYTHIWWDGTYRAKKKKKKVNLKAGVWAEMRSENSPHVGQMQRKSWLQQRQLAANHKTTITSALFWENAARDELKLTYWHTETIMEEKKNTGTITHKQHN